MAEAGVIKEFLVSLGWKNDEVGQKRMQDSLLATTFYAVKLGEALVNVAGKAISFTHQVAQHFESLANASERTKTSVRNIEALKYAVSQLGGTAEGAMSSLERFAEKLRNQPGYLDHLEKTFRVKTKDAAGRMRDHAELLKELIDSPEYARADPYLRRQFAEQFGIDERTQMALEKRSERLRYETEYQEKLKKSGLDPEKVAENARNAERAFRSFSQTVKMLGAAFVDAMTAEGGEKFQRFIEWLDNHSGSISEGIRKVVKWTIDWAEWIGKLALSVGRFVRDEANPWIKSISGVEHGFEKLGFMIAAIYLTHIPALIAAFARLVAIPAFKALMFAAKMLGVGGAAGLYALLYPSETGGSAFEEDDRRKTLEQNPDAFKKQAEPQDPGKSVVGRAKRWWRRNAPGWLGGGGDKAAKSSYNDPNDFYDAIIKAEGTGKYGDPYNTSLGYMKSPKPLVEMTMKESLSWGDVVRRAQGMNSSAKGAFQIVNTTQRAAMAALGIKDDEIFSEENQRRMASWIVRKQGLGAWEGFKFHPSQRARAAAALARGEDKNFAYQEPVSGGAADYARFEAEAAARRKSFAANFAKYGLSPIGAAAAAPIGHNTVTSYDFGRNVTLNNKNNFVVNSAGDAGATARSIAGMQARVNTNLIRNLQSAAQ